METKYTKLSALVGDTFTINSVGLPTYKMWAEGEKRFVTSVTPQEGFQKKYPTETDKGILDLSQGQLGQCLMAAFDGAKAEVTNKTFKVGSNGQTGKDIRYYFDLAGVSQAGSQGVIAAQSSPQATNEGQNPTPPATNEPPSEEIPF